MGDHPVEERELVTDNQATLCVARDDANGQTGYVRLSAQLEGTPSEISFPSLSNAKLFFGLWRAHGPFVIEFSDEFIPRPVAVAGKPAIAAYLAMVYDQDVTINTREETAAKLGVGAQTISNYWQEIRWDGCLACAAEEMETRITVVEGDEVQVADCLACGAYHVVPEDTRGLEHVADSDECVSGLVRAVGINVGETFSFDHCPACGFYTAQV